MDDSDSLIIVMVKITCDTVNGDEDISQSAASRHQKFLLKLRIVFSAFVNVVDR